MFLLAFGILNICRSVVKATPVPGTLSVPPSEYWDGNDGRWSTFFVQVGTPPQVLRLLPGTSASAGTTLWLVLPEGCSILHANDSGCSTERGQTFLRNSSSSWLPKTSGTDGLFQLTVPEEQYLGLTGNAYYGFDTVTLSIGGSGLPTLPHQTIAGIATDDFWLGSLGLSPISFNFSNFNDPQPSLLAGLRNQSFISSFSWAYTAGAFYKDVPTYGSLTLGGYDTTKFVPNNVSTAFGPDSSRDLLIRIQSITYETAGISSTLADETGTFAFIDSLVTPLWLPLNVCQEFEKAFNLTWNDTMSLYLLDDSTHMNLMTKNPCFTFTLGSLSDGGTLQIVIPYAAFDLNITANGTEQRYFPLKRAQNSSQYTLGRVFLQEAYIIADYDHQNFSVSQALFPDTSTPENVVAIASMDHSGSGQPDHSKTSGLSTVSKIVIAVCVFVLFLVVVGLLSYYQIRRRRSSRAGSASDTQPGQSRPDTPRKDLNSTAAGQEIICELDTAGNQLIRELDTAVSQIPEIDASGVPPIELSAGDRHLLWHELPAE
ncbi:MAG: hypothetical protein M1820_004879 [Bogoriella megaspora]|nr:MAG: hypothetical protein M1820_004879 [Bogoriella megaspora]